MEFSPDGRQLLVGSFDGTGKVVDVDTGEVVGEPLGVGNFSAAELGWTADGSGIIVIDNGVKEIRILDARTRQPASRRSGTSPPTSGRRCSATTAGGSSSAAPTASSAPSTWPPDRRSATVSGCPAAKQSQEP